jgi:predicted transposase YdaD
LRLKPPAKHIYNDLFLPPAKTITIAPNYQSTFLGIHAHQDYRIINLWELDANLAFQADLLSLLPFVPPEMLEQAAYQLRQNKTLDEFSPLLGFFANFVLDSNLVQQILRWDMVVLEESPWYNEIIRRGETRGRQEEACEMVLGLLTRRTGSITPQIEIQIRSLKREQLERPPRLHQPRRPHDLATASRIALRSL